ncbi:helix-turn-helix domain-containing protein [Pseudomonas syringae pv. avii]|nr:helix-turn-helix domain-containing protein [Pseudomonas syringae pv. avii]
MSITLLVERQSQSRGFTMIPNHIINDENLSLKAKGLISALLSLPPGYEHLSVERLAVKYKTGTTAIRSGIKELQHAGYLKVEQKYDTRGHYAGYEWRLRDQPENSKVTEISQDLPYMENPHSGDPTSDNPRPINTYKTKKPKTKNTTTTQPPILGEVQQELRLTAPMLTETSEQVFKALGQVDPLDRQRMLDELCAAIKSGAIKTTPIRWFHGALKRYREGAFNFTALTSQDVQENSPAKSVSTARDSPPSVNASKRSDVGLEYLGKLKKTTRSPNSSP